MSRCSFAIVSRGGELESVLESSPAVEVRARVDDLEELVQTVAEKRPDAPLVALDEDPEAVFDAVEKLLAPKPLLFFHGPDDSRLILRAMRCGAREYIAPAPDAKGSETPRAGSRDPRTRASG